MSHSGCYGPLPGSGHRTLTSLDRSLSRGSTPASKQSPWSSFQSHMRQEDKRVSFSGSQLVFSSRFPNDTPPRLSALEASRVPSFPSLPRVSHSLTPSVWTRPQPHPVRS